jgi:hypothetical protein
MYLNASSISHRRPEIEQAVGPANELDYGREDRFADYMRNVCGVVRTAANRTYQVFLSITTVKHTMSLKVVLNKQMI